MYCKRCEYPLWNLTTRTCPECGLPFAPSNYDFVPDSVRFCCPFCKQDYYGTGERGHLVPGEFDCVQCGKHVRMDDMVLLPTEGLAEEQTKVDVVPWLDRARLGFLKGWFGTIGMALVGPRRLARAIPSESRLGSAFWFALFTGCVYFALGWLILIPVLAGAVMTGGGFAVLGVVLVPLTIAAVLICWALVSHLILRISGSTTHGLARTFICFCYAAGACVLAAVPCIGVHLSLVAWIWMAVSVGFMLAATHGVSMFRAMIAAFLPPVVTLAALVALIIVTIIPSMTAAMAMAGPAMVQARAQPATVQIVTALHQYAFKHNGEGPPHAMSLLADSTISLSDVFLNGAPQTPAEGMVSGVDLVDLMLLTPAQQANRIAGAAATLPGDGAHRIGDMVFTYQGIDLTVNSSADPNLWIVICAPLKPQVATPGLPPMPYYAGALGGNIVTIPPAKLDAQLAKQNELRAAAGLPPLPDPLTVRQSPQSTTPPTTPPTQPPEGSR